MMVFIGLETIMADVSSSKKKAILREKMPISSIKETVLFRSARRLFKRSKRQGDVIHAELVYPVPQRTILVPFLADTVIEIPNDADWKRYNTAYGK
jgi:hypothetical protein